MQVLQILNLFPSSYKILIEVDVGVARCFSLLVRMEQYQNPGGAPERKSLLAVLCWRFWCLVQAWLLEWHLDAASRREGMLCSPMVEGRGCTKVTKAILVSFRFSGVCACVSAVAHGGPEDDIRVRGAGVIGSCGPPDMGTENRTPFLFKCSPCS